MMQMEYNYSVKLYAKKFVIVTVTIHNGIYISEQNNSESLTQRGNNS